MAKITVDFTGAPPAQGGGQDRVPAGKYALKLTSMEPVKAGTGANMIRVGWDIASGDHVGKQLRDQFVLDVGKNNSKFGLQRFHALLVALGAPQSTGKASFDTDRLLGRVCEAQVGDQELAANGEYEARVVSQPRAYYALGTSGTQAKAAATAAAPAAPAAKPAAAAAPKPAAAKPKPAPVVVEETVEEEEETELTLGEETEDATDISDEVDDLFA